MPLFQSCHVRICMQAAQQGDATKVDKRRKKKQKDAADDAAFLDEGGADGEYQDGAQLQPLYALPRLWLHFLKAA